MGAWGTGPLTNDTAQDFLAELRSLRGGERVARVLDAFAEYEAFDRRRREGLPPRTLSDAEKRALLASRDEALAANAHDREGFLKLLPEYSTPESWAAYVETMAAEPDDGTDAAMRSVAAAWLVAEALGRVPRPASPGLLAGEARAVLDELAAASRGMLDRVLDDADLRRTWFGRADAWSEEVRRVRDALAPDAPEVPAGAVDDAHADEATALRRENWIYRNRMLLVLAAIMAAVTLFR